MTVAANTRAQAIALGLAKYSTGRPCARGHTSLRYAASGACVACVAGYHNDWQAARDRRRRGAEPLTVLVHPEDVPAVTALVDALAVARALA